MIKKQNINKSSISLIAAVAANRVIGNKGKIPWNLPEDLKHFKDITKGSPVIMGRKTYNSIIEALGHPLPNRTNIVISTTMQATQEIMVFKSLEDCLKFPNLNNELFVIGGERLYTEAIKLAKKLYITEIDKSFNGDTYFPKISNDWVINSYSPSENEQFRYRFLEYIRSDDATQTYFPIQM